MKMTPRTSSAAVDWRSARRRLSAWYRRHRRDLPWRRRQHDPYAQLVAELMLHQTQVATVVPYYLRFLERFPTVQDLACADRADVLALWTGLGYYRRCHLLHEAANRIVHDLHGTFPRTVEGLMQLPGVGRYTAGAIASIAFDQRVPLLDGNVKRVLLRMMAIRDDPGVPRVNDRLWDLALEALPARNCGDFNQALMELGATVCTPRQPGCDACPLRDLCEARQRGLVDEIPRPRPRRSPRAMTMAALVVTAGHRVLVRRRPVGSLWPGAWEIPSMESNGRFTKKQFQNLVPATILARLVDVHAAGDVTHQLTHRTIKFRVHAATARATRLPAGFAWMRLDHDLPLPTAFRKVLDTALRINSGQRESAGHSVC